jgi:hypothetical protein
MRPADSATLDRLAGFPIGKLRHGHAVVTDADLAGVTDE